MLSRNLFILAATLIFFSILSYVIAFTGLAHEPGAPTEDSLWRTIGAVLLLLGLVTSLMGVLQRMFEQADRRSPGGGQSAIHRAHLRRNAEQKARRQAERRQRG